MNAETLPLETRAKLEPSESASRELSLRAARIRRGRIIPFEKGPGTSCPSLSRVKERARVLAGLLEITREVFLQI